MEFPTHTAGASLRPQRAPLASQNPAGAPSGLLHGTAGAQPAREKAERRRLPSPARPARRQSARRRPQPRARRL